MIQHVGPIGIFFWGVLREFPILIWDVHVRSCLCKWMSLFMNWLFLGSPKLPRPFRTMKQKLNNFRFPIKYVMPKPSNIPSQCGGRDL